MECSQQILAGGEIDCSFSADGCVHLSKHGGRNLDHIHPTHVEGGQQTSDISHDAPAKGDENDIAISSQARQFLGQQFNRCQPLVALTVTHFYELCFKA